MKHTKPDPETIDDQLDELYSAGSRYARRGSAGSCYISNSGGKSRKTKLKGSVRTADPNIPVRYTAVNPLTVFIVLILFLIVGATPWLVFSKTKEMCKQAMQEAITNTY